MLAEHGKLRSSHASRVSQTLLAAIGSENKTIEVKRCALEAAAPLSLLEVRKAIREAYQSNDAKLRASAVYAMGRNCDGSWLPVLLKELTSADAEIRYEAAGACGELGEKEAIPYLIGLIDDPDTDVQLAAIRALGEIGGNEAKESLEQYLDHTNEIISQMVEQTLRELEAEEELF